MGKSYTSKGQLDVGKKGEETILSYIKKNFNAVDVKEITGLKYKCLRKFDIDFVCNFDGKIDDNILLGGDIDLINKKYLTIELKSDTIMYRTGNMYLEDVLITVKDRKHIDGFMRKCKAKLFMYQDVTGNKLYSGWFGKLKKYYDNNITKFKQAPIVDSEVVGTNEKCYVYGHLVPIMNMVKIGLMFEAKNF